MPKKNHPKVQCKDSPDGEHSPYTDIIWVNGERHLAVICWWCGKQVT